MMKNSIDEAETYLIHSYNRYPVELDHGQGVYLFDTEGKKYLDFGGGIAVSAAASAALGAISEDGSILGKSLIFVGLAEGVCLYGLIISFMILGQL